MKIAYIAHPISGDIQRNLSFITAIGRQINLEEPDTIPFAPYFFDCYCLDDNDPEERKRGIKNDTYLISCCVDEIRLYGNKISNGMKHEIKLAFEHDIPVIPMTKETEIEFENILNNGLNI